MPVDSTLPLALPRARTQKSTQVSTQETQFLPPPRTAVLVFISMVRQGEDIKDLEEFGAPNRDLCGVRVSGFGI
jgi:hypothetical protein